MILFCEIFFHSIFEILPISSSFFSGILSFSMNIYLLHGISGFYSFLYFLPRITEFLNFKFILFLLYFLFFNGLFFLIFFAHENQFNMLFYITLSLIYIFIEVGIEKSRRKNAMVLKLNSNDNLFNNRKFVNRAPRVFLWVFLVNCGLNCLIKSFFGERYQIFMIFFSIILYLYSYFKNNGRNEENLNFLQAYDLSIIILMASFCSGISRLGSLLSYLLISNFSFKRSVIYGFMLSGIVNCSFFLAKLFFSFEEFKLLFMESLPSGNIIYFLGIIAVIFLPIFFIMRFCERYSKIFILFGVIFRMIIFFYLILFH